MLIHNCYLKNILKGKNIGEINYLEIGQKIRNQRIDHGLSQEALAERVNLSVSFIGHIERGTKSMSINTLLAISKSLNMSLDHLLLNSVDD